MKVVVVGSGSAGRHHLMALRSLPGIQAVAVPRRGSRLIELEAEGFVTARDVQTAAAEGARAAIVATSTGRHVEDARAALDEGLDVLVEKPMAVDAAEASGLQAQGSRCGRQIFVGCVLRFSESLDLFRDHLEQLGRLHAVRVECQSYLPDWRPARPYRDSYSASAKEGGVLRDLIHEIDYAGWLFGWPGVVQAKVRNVGRLGIEGDEVADLLWETPDGCVVSVHLDYLSRPSRRQIRASGERGMLEWDGINGTVTLSIVGASVRVLRTTQTREQLFVAQDRAFIDAVRGAPSAQLATGEDGVRALAVCDAVRQAAQTKREERVAYQ